MIKPDAVDTKLIEEGVDAFQKAGIRTGMRLILAVIDKGGNIDNVKTLCEEVLKGSVF